MSLFNLLYERVPKSEIIDYVEGVNGIIAVTNSNVYLARGGFLEKKVIKTYALKSISSIELKKPGIMFSGHFQIITSGNNDRTKRYSTAFDYAKDENTVMIKNDYEKFIKIEQLIYDLRDNDRNTQHQSNDDVFAQLEKLAKLKDQSIISEAEFEEKKQELLSKI